MKSTGCARVAAADFLRHGDPREQVPAGAAAGDDHAQRPGGPVAAGVRRAQRAGVRISRRCHLKTKRLHAAVRSHPRPRAVLPDAAMFIRIPIAAMFSTSEVPP